MLLLLLMQLLLPELLVRGVPHLIRQCLNLVEFAELVVRIEVLELLERLCLGLKILLLILKLPLIFLHVRPHSMRRLVESWARVILVLLHEMRLKIRSIATLSVII